MLTNSNFHISPVKNLKAFSNNSYCVLHNSGLHKYTFNSICLVQPSSLFSLSQLKSEAATDKAIVTKSQTKFDGAILALFSSRNQLLEIALILGRSLFEYKEKYFVLLSNIFGSLCTGAQITFIILLLQKR